LEHVIAAKAVAFGEALQPEFKAYTRRVIENAQALAEALNDRGYQLISGGTDNHLMLIDLRNKEVTGKDADLALGKAHITVNKNMVPFDERSPFVTSGIRVGTAAITTRGMGIDDMAVVADWIDRAIVSRSNETELARIAAEVKAKMSAYPLFADADQSVAVGGEAL
jgi:glycine hydroxymethyltransferase